MTLLAATVGLSVACAPEPEPNVVRSEGSEVRPEASGQEDPSDDDRSPTPSAAPRDETPIVLFLGTSLTAGYGLEDPAEGFPERIQGMIDGAGMDLRVVNGGVSGDTSAGGLARLGWLLEGPVEVLVLELGANDGLRGLSIDAMRDNLTQIIRQTRSAYPDVRVVLAGMEAPPNLGSRYTDEFREVFRDVASSERATLIPFLLEGVAGVPELNQADGIHPTPEGHGLVADLVWATLESVLEEVAASPAPGDL